MGTGRQTHNVLDVVKLFCFHVQRQLFHQSIYLHPFQDYAYSLSDNLPKATKSYKAVSEVSHPILVPLRDDFRLRHFIKKPERLSPQETLDMEIEYLEQSLPKQRLVA